MTVICRSYRSERESVGISFPEPSLAVQASKDECDINVIISKYLRTGVLPAARQGIYADISQMKDLQESLHQVNTAMQSFMELPAEIRREFDNDPVKLVEFASNPSNLARARALGLAPPPPEPAPSPKAGTGPAGAIGASKPASGGSELPTT